MTWPGDKYEAVVLFDGVCGLCNGTVDFIMRHDRRGRIGFAALQSEAGRRLLACCGLPLDCLDSVVLVDADGCHRESAAILKAAGYLGFPWSAAGVLGVIPRPIRDAGYRIVARRRYAWFGRREDCRMPTEEERGRFLNE